MADVTLRVKAEDMKNFNPSKEYVEKMKAVYERKRLEWQRRRREAYECHAVVSDVFWERGKHILVRDAVAESCYIVTDLDTGEIYLQNNGRRVTIYELEPEPQPDRAPT